MATHSSILGVSIKCKWKKIFVKHLDSGWRKAELDLCSSCYCYCCYQYLLFMDNGFPRGSDGKESACKKKKKNLPAVQETRLQSLGREDCLEKGLATHSSILA